MLPKNQLRKTKKTITRCSLSNWVLLNNHQIITGYHSLSTELRENDDNYTKSQLVSDQNPQPDISFMNNFHLSSILKYCSTFSDQILGKKIHCYSIKSGCEADVSVGTALLDMYMKCKYVIDAQKVFDKMPERNVVSWTSLFTGYILNGFADLVIDGFSEMKRDDVKPNPFTFASVLSASATLCAIANGIYVHCLVIKLGFDSIVFVGNSLINMYSKGGMVLEARAVFEGLLTRDEVSWNAMVAGYVHNGFERESLELFLLMRDAGTKLTHLSFPTLLKVCASLRELSLARQLHSCIIRSGFVSDFSVRRAIMVAYGKCREMDDSCKMFMTMSDFQNVVSWTAMITGYLQNDGIEQAIDLFLRVRKEGRIRPNDYTFSTILTASPSLSPFQIHAQVIKTGYLTYPTVGTALLTAYVNLGNTQDASMVFREIEERDTVSWSAMLAGYAQAEDPESGMKLYQEMRRDNGKPNEFTFSSVLDACSSPSASAEQGKQFHCSLIKHGFESALCVSTALVSMYSRRGSIESAQKVFESQLERERDLVSWNSMIAGFAQHGYGHKALTIFESMLEKGLKVDGFTLMGVLLACTHAGLLDKGSKYFNSMTMEHGISPSMEHYACMVDLYSRAGKLGEAMDLINKMPYEAGPTIWRILLGSCRLHQNLDMGKLAAEKLMALKPQDSAAYVLLSNMYASAGNWVERSKIRKLMEERGIKKEAGYSWIEVKNKVHSFMASDRSHPLSEQIYLKLEELGSLLKLAGYRPDTNFVLYDVEEEHKEHILSLHSERLALAFGLISTPHGMPLQIVKNLRVCGDCHTVLKLLSEILEREIVVRDSNRFHHFKGGSCSCGDYW
ncbi:hypothetical protein AMTRI_Chr11g93890 [Amborella trichopoda]